MTPFQDRRPADAHVDEGAFAEFAGRYKRRYAEAVLAMDEAALLAIARIFAEVRANGGTVLVAGNGGSAAVANHFECDASKNTFHAHEQPLMSRSLAANPSVLTALGNDIGFESVFDHQIAYFAKPHDAVVLVSSSGNSPNVINACKVAKSLGLKTIALVGFKGGALKDLADVVLHVPVDNYGIVEDLHMSTIHLITQFLRGAWEPTAR